MGSLESQGKPCFAGHRDGRLPAGYCGVAVFLAYVLSIALMRRWTKGPLLAPLAGPFIGAPVFFFVILRTALLGRRRGGVLWRDTLYPEKVLREGMRVRF